MFDNNPIRIQRSSHKLTHFIDNLAQSGSSHCDIPNSTICLCFLSTTPFWLCVWGKISLWTILWVWLYEERGL